MLLTQTLRMACPIVAALLCSAAWCQPAPVASPAAPRAGPSAEQPFESLHRTIERLFPDVGSVVVLRRGELLFEHYQAGTDADALHAVQSVTKSVVALLVGIALDRGALASLDQPIVTLLPGAMPQQAVATDPPITIRHLLTMTAGFEPARDFRRTDADDPQFLTRRHRSAAPGAVFHYDNLAANLLAIALEAATGQPVSAFAQQNLFEPLGIAGFDWEVGRHGHALGFAGLYLRTLDMAKLGQLVLQQGAWQGKQLVSKGFVDAAVQPQSVGGDPVGQAYGYLWWVVRTGKPRPTFFASGYGGQLIWVYPPLDLVVATTSVVSEASNARGQALTLIRNDIFRALTSGADIGRLTGPVMSPSNDPPRHRGISTPRYCLPTRRNP